MIEPLIGKPERPTHPTKKLLLDITAELLEQMALEDVICDLVLERSHVSKGSLYYHFEDFPDVVEQSVATKLRMEKIPPLERLIRFFEESDSPMEIVEKIMATSQDRKHSSASFILQTNANYLSLNSERMKKLIWEINTLESDCWKRILQICRERGWSTKEIDPTTVAMLFKSIVYFDPDLHDGDIDLVSSQHFKAFAFLFETILFQGIVPAESSPTSESAIEAADEQLYRLDTSHGFSYSKFEECYLRVIYGLFRIEPIGPQYFDVVKELHVRSSDMPKYVNPTVDIKSAIKIPGMAGKSPIVYGVFHSSKLVGFLTGTLRDGNFEFLTCSIDRQYRNRGLASALVSYVIISKLSDGVTSFSSMETPQALERLTVMENLGFQRVGVGA